MEQNKNIEEQLDDIAHRAWIAYTDYILIRSHGPQRFETIDVQTREGVITLTGFTNVYLYEDYEGYCVSNGI